MANHNLSDHMTDVLNSLTNDIQLMKTLETDFHDCVNELCHICGQYRQEHQGVCDDCRWLKPRRGW